MQTVTRAETLPPIVAPKLLKMAKRRGGLAGSDQIDQHSDVTSVESMGCN